MKQYEAVIKVMEENGGYSTLGHLYEGVLKVPNVIWKTRTPFASIRRIVQQRDEIFRIKPGLWALKTYRDTLPNEVLSLIKESKQPEKEGKTTHYFYQGMIVEIGNLKGFKTYIPPQDKNKRFLDKTLKEIANLKTILKFTYDDLINKIKSIDVLWFNIRKLPASIFEVEHTTDFKNGLLKFLELQDFNVKMYIVSSSVRKREFDNKVESSTFEPIRNRVKFLSYENISKWHSKTTEFVLIERKIEG